MLKHIKTMVAAFVVVSSSTAVVAACFTDTLINCTLTVVKYYETEPSTTCTLTDITEEYPSIRHTTGGEAGKVSWYMEATNRHCDYFCGDGSTLGPRMSAAYSDGASCVGTPSGG